MASGGRASRRESQVGRSDAIEEMISEGLIESVQPDSPAAIAELGMAKAHLDSVDRVLEIDPTLAYAALYDAARKAISAEMRLRGVRIRGQAGMHVKTFAYARRMFAGLGIDDSLGALERMRRNRHGSEYSVSVITASQIRRDFPHAQAIVAKIEELLTR
jgi:hypothetical protein